MRKFALKLISFYQKTLSPDHGLLFLGRNPTCRYIPTCSQYTYEAVEKYGILHGGLMGLKRIFRCNPWHKSGFDPLI